MFDFVQNNKKILHIVLLLLIVPSFAFWGVSTYFRDRNANDDIVASIGDQKITPEEFRKSLEERQDQLRSALKGKVDESLLDNAEFRGKVLDDLIRQRVLLERAVRDGIVVPNRMLQEIIGNTQAFQKDGKFSVERYQELLKDNGLTESKFEEQERREVMPQLLSAAYRATAFVPAVTVERVLTTNAEQREASYVMLTPQQFENQAKPDPAAVSQYYKEHASEFQAPEQARVDYIVLALDDVAASMPIGADEAKQYYTQNAAQYAQAEQRRASHILITVDAKADAATRQAARARAEQLAQQVRANPAAFPELARKFSQDPGSAGNGGDLGWFPHGAMVKPFDDAVFALKPGEVAGPVETQYGYHVIRLTAMRGAGFDDVRPRIEADLKRRKAREKFAALSDQLNTVAFEQNDSLQPAADALKLTIHRGAMVGRAAAEDPLLNNDKLRKAVFSDDVMKAKHNSEVIDAGNGNLVVVRVTDYQPAHLRPLEEVQADIELRLAKQQAAQRAAQQGRDTLARLKQGENVPLSWTPPRQVSRGDPQGMPPALLAELFKADVTKLPAYVGAESPMGGYILLKITALAQGTPNPAAHDALAQQLRQVEGQNEFEAFVAALKARQDIKTHPERIESKDAAAPADSAPQDAP